MGFSFSEKKNSSHFVLKELGGEHSARVWVGRAELVSVVQKGLKPPRAAEPLWSQGEPSNLESAMHGYMGVVRI